MQSQNNGRAIFSECLTGYKDGSSKLSANDALPAHELVGDGRMV